ncbi:MAG: hypothetical protein K8R74_06185, partial [Bacteroidales bacterium]|nr:hypothetical protein [Bacteroidales bacterium]
KAIRKRIKKSNIIPSKEKPAVSTIKLQHTVKKDDNMGKGLEKEISKSGNNFLELDLSHEWDDSAIQKVFFHKDCIIKTYRFFEDSIRSVDTESTANETGGYLIGQWDFSKENPKKYDVSLEDFIQPGDDATFSKYQLNFGAKIGVKLQKVLDNYRQKTNRDFVMTAWFHSHPGLKIFLSDYDINVQEDFARNNHKHRMLALVLDPYTPNWDMGIFSYKTSGTMNNAVDSKRFFSFDNIYKWAINSGKDVISDKFFVYNLFENYPEAKTKKVYISNPGILAIKRYIEDKKLDSNPEAEIAFIGGQKILHDYRSNDILVEGIVDFDQDQLDHIASNNRIVGCLLCTSFVKSDSGKNLLTKIRAQNKLNENLQIALIYDLEEQIIRFYPIVKDLEKEMEKLSISKIQFPDLVDWTRKRE